MPMRDSIAIWPLILLPIALQSQQREDSAREATKLWEQMIEAKGGRSVLYRIETMVQEAHDYLKFHNPKFKDGDQHRVSAFAFPDRIWGWSKAPVFEGGVQTADLSADTGYIGYPNGNILKTSDLRGEKGGLKNTQLVYLCETKWIKPKPVRVLLEKNIPRNVEAIETDLDGERVDFWIDRGSHLPIKIITYRDFKYGQGLEPSYTWDLSDYQRMNGIQIPQQVGFFILSNPPSTTRYTTILNPKLREDLFTSPPRFEDGPDAWKSK
jgi:hypothetical protein